jgi:hypothetical protein
MVMQQLTDARRMEKSRRTICAQKEASREAVPPATVTMQGREPTAMGREHPWRNPCVVN